MDSQEAAVHNRYCFIKGSFLEKHRLTCLKTEEVWSWEHFRLFLSFPYSANMTWMGAFIMMNDNVDHWWGNLQTDHSACQYGLPLSKTGEERPILFPLLPLLFHKNVPRQPIPQHVKGRDGSTRSAALWLSSASYISHTAEYRMLLLGLSLGSISIWPYVICPLPSCPTFSWNCARISVVVWWFFGTIVGCLNALAKVDLHGLPPTFSTPSLSVRALIYDTSADSHLSSSAQRHRVFVNMLLWSRYYEVLSFLLFLYYCVVTWSVGQPWSLQCKQFKPQIAEHKQVN